MTRNEGSKTRLVAGSGIDLLVKLMELHGGSAAVQSRSCYVLGVLAMHETVIKRIHKIGGISNILSAFHRYRKDENVVANCSLALANIASCCGTSQDILLGGGFERLLEGMSRFPLNVLVFSRACEVMGNMATDQRFETVFARSKGVQTIIRGMRLLFHMQEAQISGCRALLNLAHNEKNKWAIFEHGGTDLILASMQQHPSNARVQMFGCWAIHKMIFKNETVRKHVEDIGGEKIIARVIKDLSDDSSLLVMHLHSKSN